ncbi:T9SS type A sorting domain-containing protein [Spirosoma sp. KNUC1025]|uniref:T9SS type A sorting domain-containing protein n=1 Tax=Spirosoma sp. KNUC1025 TaxID=2894082 RepID=UPI00386EBA35|nr:T9SS type A sorting domain-containing protein [Spirosoma sp. KNUC1025]
MIKIRFTLLGLGMLLMSLKGLAQTQANPAITAATLSPTTPLAGVGAPFSMTFTIGTNGGSEGLSGATISEKMGFSVCLGKANWATGDALTSVSGSLLSKFTLSLNGTTGCLDGLQSAPLAATELLDLVVNATVTTLSTTTATADIGASCNIAPAPSTNGYNPTTDDFKSVYTTTATALPVSLVNFSAQAESDRTVLVKWTTSWEKANKGYVVERSKDLRNFENIGEVTDVAGTSNSVNTYRFVDPNPYRGTSYYRLRQVDLDGSIRTYDAKSVVIDGRYGVYPNPVANQNFTLELDEPTTAVLRLYNATGSELGVMKSEQTEVSTKVTPSTKLATGVYVLTVEERGTTRKHRLVVQ